MRGGWRSGAFEGGGGRSRASVVGVAREGVKRDRDGVRDGDWGKTVVVAPMLGGSHMWGPLWVNRANWIAVQQAELKMCLNFSEPKSF